MSHLHKLFQHGLSSMPGCSSLHVLQVLVSNMSAQCSSSNDDD